VRANTIPDEFRLRTPNDDELGVRFTDRNESGLCREEKEFADP
jgi:hypothetical protein